ncbi:hypothetical protein NRD16_003679 [Photobacterium damselae]|nr:hypothetical protein [Photobacterium damselae]
MEFSETITKRRNQLKITQHEMCYLLSKYHSVFSSVDVTSLSRWERGEVKPTALRKIVMLDVLGDLNNAVLNLDFEIPQSYLNNMELFEKQMYTGVSDKILNYFSNKETVITIDKNNFHEYNNVLSKLIEFYLINRSGVYDLYEKYGFCYLFEKLELKILCNIVGDELIIGHICHIKFPEKDDKSLICERYAVCQGGIGSGCLYIPESLITTKDFLIKSINFIYKEIVNNKQVRVNGLIFNSGRIELSKWLESFGGELIKTTNNYITPSKKRLVFLDSYKFLSNPLFIKFYKEQKI